MKTEEINIAIAEVCGFTVIKGSQVKVVEAGQAIWPHTVKDCPDYHGSLDAMHEAEKVLSDGQTVTYYHHLWENVEDTGEPTLNFAIACKMEASQRAEAFLRTLNLWK